MSKWILIVVIVTVLILLFLYRRPSKREKLKGLFDASTGDLDKNAREAIKIAEGMSRRAEDSFRLAQLLELNTHTGNMNRADLAGDTDDIIKYYQEVLDDIQQAPTRTMDPPAMFMVDYIGGFIDRNDYGILYQDYTTAGNDVLEATKQQITADNKLEYAEKLLSTTHTSDPQNVHDSAVNVGLRETLDNLRRTTHTHPMSKCVEDATKYIHDCDLDTATKRKALRGLDRCCVGDFNYTVGASESEVFAVVWSRAYLEQNRSNSDLIKESVVKSLADFYENDEPICINGRIGRMLTSLVLIDHDETVGKVNTVENYKNEVMEKVKKALSEAIEQASKNPDPKWKQLAESYEDPEVEIEPEVEAQFKQELKYSIDCIVDEYADKLGTAKETTRQNAYAAIE